MDRTAPDHVTPGDNRRSVHFLPSTALGWWAVALAGIGVGLVAVNGLFMLAGVFTPLVGLGYTCAEAGGVIGLVAVFRGRDRAVTVFLSLLPLAATVVTVVLVLIGLALGQGLPE